MSAEHSEFEFDEPVNPWEDAELLRALAGLNALNGISPGQIGSYEIRAVDTTGAKLYLIINAAGGVRDAGPEIARSAAELTAMIRAYRRGLEDGRGR
jgi:hypothetical protein